MHLNRTVGCGWDLCACVALSSAGGVCPRALLRLTHPTSDGMVFGIDINVDGFGVWSKSLF